MDLLTFESLGQEEFVGCLHIAIRSYSDTYSRGVVIDIIADVSHHSDRLRNIDVSLTLLDIFLPLRNLGIIITELDTRNRAYASSSSVSYHL